jgi:hypothetical protein
VPRTGSRPALTASLLAFAGVLLAPAVTPNLAALVATLFLLAAVNSVVDVATNAQGVDPAAASRAGSPACARCMA